jgi:hypothetical protein
MASRLSSYLSQSGEWVNLTWNDTSVRNPAPRRAIWEWDDATWILAASFIIFTMQTGKLIAL